VPIVSTTKDPDALSFTIVTDLAAPPTRVWQIWSDPRQLERWWGPPTWPATVEQHDFVVGGRATYYMTGPDGEKSRGWWRFLALDAPRSLEFEDGFADESGEPSDAMPVIRGLVELEATTSGTRMTITTSFASVADMEQIMGMGVVEGMTGAMGQIDNIVAEG
jgi:uncharacterized protein YndB with AHSA1/START domain